MTQNEVNTLFADAERAVQQGRLADAERLLDRVRAAIAGHPRPWHLTAIVAERAGRPADALAAFRRAAELAPHDANLLVDYADRLPDTELAQALALYDRALAIAPRLTSGYLGRGRRRHRAGRFADSRADFLRVYQLDPLLADGWLARGAMELDAAVPEAAAICFDRALAIRADDPVALAGRARTALELGQPQAVALYEAAARHRPDDSAIAMAEAEAREAAGEAVPHRRLAELVARKPAWAEGQALLCRMLWEGGSPDYDRSLRQALITHPHDPALYDALIGLLAGIDRFADAADAAAIAADRTGSIHFRLAEARFAGSAGQLDRAGALYDALPADLPGRDLDEARHLIRRGALDRAGRLVEQAIASNGSDVLAWALMDLIWRATGDARADWLHRQPGLIRQHVLPFDAPGIAGMAGDLRRLHHRVRHPTGQSMRRGTQTRGPLLSRQDEFVRALRAAIAAAVLEHWRGLPPIDPRHPLLRHRDKTPTLSGSWSVRLGDGGHHVGHVHPQGLLSSASYWAVPERHGREGWLEIGRPPADLGLDLPPIAEFEPVPGSLILFPSTLYHGTRPFGAGERITVAFDIAAA